MTTEQTVTELVRRARDGDEAATTEIVRRYEGLVRAVVRRAGLDEHTSRDAAQETWCVLIQKLPELRDPERLGGWLTVVARRASWRTCRAARREVPVDLSTDDVTGRLEAAPPADLTVLAADEARAVTAAVRRLPDRQRIVLTALASDEPPSYADLARSTGLPIGSIGPVRGRALRALRAGLAPALGMAS